MHSEEFLKRQRKTSKVYIDGMINYRQYDHLRNHLDNDRFEEILKRILKRNES